MTFSLRRSIENLKLWQKFALVGALALAMAAIPASLVVQRDLASVQAARTEAQGIAPAGRVLELLRLTQQLRGLSAGFLAGDQSMGAARQLKQSEVEQALAAAIDALSGDAAFAGLLPAAQAIGRNLEPLNAAVANKSIAGPESFARHNAIVASELGLLEQIVDVSTLALDPEGGSQYVIRALFGYLPELTENLGQARAKGAALLATGTPAPAERMSVSVLGSLAQYNHRRIETAFAKALAASPELETAIGEPLARALAAAGAGLALMNERILVPERLTYPSGEYFAAMTSAIDAQFALIEASFTALDAMLAARVAGRQQELVMVSAAIGLLLLVATGIMVLVTAGTVRALRRTVQVAHTVAGGDLTSTIEVGSTDETGQMLAALKEMNASLAGIVARVRGGAHEIAAAAGQIAAGNHDLSSRTEAQAASLEETAASMEQMAGTVARNADNARQAHRLAAHAADVARDGGQAVGRVVQTMGLINASSGRIADIVGIIDGIAFQTNILALNAAVEAARAGQQGRGFAVVAAEVRTLAQRCGAAAKEIRALIDESVRTVGAGTAQVDAAGRTMAAVVDSIQRVADMMAEITAASQEQTTGIEQVNQAVAQMDQATQQNAALVQEAAAAAQSLRDQADQLVAAIGVFRVAASRDGQARGIASPAGALPRTGLVAQG